MIKHLLSAALLIASLFLITPNLKAIGGGEIWYEYIGNSAHPYRYKVSLGLYRYAGEISMCLTPPCTKYVCITSSCYSATDVTLTQKVFTSVGPDTTLGPDGSIIPANSLACVDTNTVVDQFGYYLFEGIVDLPGTCSNFKFSYAGSDSRDLVQNFDGFANNLYLEAFLNNTLGNNSSPHFLSPGIRAFCANKSYVWPQSAYDPDGDSLYYSLGNSLSGSCGQSPSNISYNPGYSSLQPITTSNGVTFNQSGQLIFTPTQQEYDEVNIRISEYRSSGSVMSLIGTTMRDARVSIDTVCKNSSVTFKANPSDTTANGIKFQKLMCGDSIIHITTNTSIDVTTLDTDGSNFFILNSQGVPDPVVAAGSDGPNGYTETNKIWLKLYQPVNYNDTLSLSVRVGNSTNRIRSICNDTLKDSLYLISDLCNTGFGLKENSFEKINVFPNPVQDHISIVFQNFSPHCFLSILDLSGRIIYHKELLEKKNTIDTEKLAHGVYLLSINGSKVHQQLLIQKL